MVVDTNKLRIRLLQRITARWQVATEILHLGPMRLPFTRIADPNRVLDEVAMAEDRREKTTGLRKSGDELHLPYWAELWESSHAMACFVVEQWAACGREDSFVAHLAKQAYPGGQTQAAGLKVMDLGCGMGLAGVAAARLGVQVLFADLETPALLFARLNSLADAPRCRARRVNWQKDRFGEKFHMIMGADIVYDRSQWQYLEPFFRAHLAENGAVLLGEPGRSSGEEFAGWITQRNWRIQLRTQNLPGSARPIHLLEMQTNQ